MKKATLITIALCFTVSSLLANETYYQKMGETLQKFNKCSSVEEFREVANTFANISRVETKEWLPLYYEAHCYILMSFIDRTGANDSYLDQAETSINKMLELVPEEGEVYALQAFYHTGRLVVNPAERAMTTAPLVSQSLGKALSLDPGNPRALYIKLSNEMGTAQYFGQDTAPMCKQAQLLLDTWDSHTPESPIHPSWGKEQTEEIVSLCSK
ncbi:MAG: hypothetical protein ABFS28_15165 [Bacteroidota bacterium]